VLPTDLTVSAVVEQDGKFLIVEERSSGLVVVNQPGGHIEAGEAPEQAVVREALEEAGCRIEVSELLGVYLWIQPQTRQQFLRIVYTATLLSQDTMRQLDDGIYAVHWYSVADLRHRQKDLRTPVVLRCVEDYLAGTRQADTFLTDVMPIQQNVSKVLANARLI
jgi:8-oxo-dGTP pyrophosphatase MutT (NUDIX family)